MERILLPPEIVELDLNTPIIFEAGPIQGSLDWQTKAAEFIHSIDAEVVIASPRRIYMDENFSYNAQVDWETFFLRRAAENGVLMFWLAKEYEHFCERAYAQTSRLELGEWKIRHERDGVKLVVGIEPGFTNERYIRRRFMQDCPDVPLLDNLEETCRKTVDLLRK